MALFAAQNHIVSPLQHMAMFAIPLPHVSHVGSEFPPLVPDLSVSCAVGLEETKRSSKDSCCLGTTSLHTSKIAMRLQDLLFEHSLLPREASSTNGGEAARPASELRTEHCCTMLRRRRDECFDISEGETALGG